MRLILPLLVSIPYPKKRCARICRLGAQLRSTAHNKREAAWSPQVLTTGKRSVILIVGVTDNENDFICRPWSIV